MKLTTLARPLLLCLTLVGTSALLQGCVALLIGGAAATTGVVVVDRRTVGQQVEDKTIEIKVANSIRSKFGDSVRINTTSYEGVVLVTGDSLGNDRKAAITEIASKTQSVKSVSNQVNVVKETASFGELSSDTWLSSKVMTTLATTNEVPSRTIVVVTDRSVVYLMGLVTQREGDLAAAATAQVSGVKRVDKLFQVISPAEANKLDDSNRIFNRSSSGNTTPLGEAPSTAAPAAGAGVEVLPIK
ncbi:MAG: BON domain-containing protein [Alcaligenaceae bacterium]|nr:BON domain-containing protein [Alcaligenaceae bacterium]